jgi:hypothetical protein
MTQNNVRRSALFAALAICIALAAGCSSHKDNTTRVQSETVGAATSPGRETRGVAATSPTSGSITDLKSLTPTTDPQSVAGRGVQLSNMKVEEMVDRYVISVGTENDPTRIYVYLHQPIENLKVGDKLNLSGFISLPSTFTIATAAAGSEGSKRLNAQPFFVEAQSAQLSK